MTKSGQRGSADPLDPLLHRRQNNDWREELMIMMMMLIMMIMIGSDQAVYTFISSHRIEREVSNASSKHSLVIVPLLF